ncbi:MAG: protein TolR [Gammaproteobacteria bacterium]|nr:protein TolR [Gammaproteobacteria bacterium]
MSRRSTNRRQPIAEMNVVPYIDVMLVLLVIFMITAPLLTQGVKVDLPQAESENIKQPEQEPIIVSVDNKGLLYLNVSSQPDVPIDENTLVNRVAALLRLHPKTPVMVRGDHQVDYGAVVSAMALLQKAGAPSVGLMTRPVE